METSTYSSTTLPSTSSSPLTFYNSLPPSNYTLFDLTVTPMSYRDRITVEFILNISSWLLSTFLVVFVRLKKAIWVSLKVRFPIFCRRIKK
ncbi:hypothetical protein B9Z55_001153 [Caenorhabditis nigoni]|uniref:Uncharacterized protein n=1 Tax=Caenorhabditis nigoni TaxID=1611254 RepID=A0A2G5VEM7_9PELO|nr:hypothetical protein B9Z55_001153 [Caenorhabditis nigoni]